MSLLDKSASKDQLIDILNSMKLPIMGAGGGFAPIGTINFFDASVAPQGWLACDGQTYNISDYPDLATYYASVHGASNYYGGNGTTTFAVPNLQGEFLRGAGTNSHANQGDGANVGVHQDGTEHPYVGTEEGIHQIEMVHTPFYYQNQKTKQSGMDAFEKASGICYINSNVGNHYNDINCGFYTSRPTNTSFLICVKATVAGDPNAHQYSTEEQVVGKWVDGSDVYERTITGLSTKVKYDDWITITTIPSLKYIINAVAYCTESSELRGGIVGCIEWYNDGGVVKCESLVNIDLRIINSVTIQYTKSS